MNTKNLFELAVRLLGLVFLYHGLQQIPAAVIQFFTMIGHHNLGGLVGCIMTAWPLLLAFWLIRGAAWLVNVAFPRES